jgi:prevent-host-death family protein
MSHHGIAEAKNKLSELIDRALRGEGVVITRHGRPVVELRALEEPVRRMTPADLDWLAERRVPVKAPSLNAAELVSAMRDEDEH